MKENVMGKVCSMHGRVHRSVKVLKSVNLFVKDLVGDVDIDGSIILTEILDEVWC
jgi:hypothetical protein